MEIIKVNTERGLELKGAIFGDNKMETVVIIMSGICSNLFQNELLHTTGNLLSKNNIACIIGHSMDAFSCFSYSDLKTGKQTTTGVFNNDFSVVYEDVESYVKYALQMGFKNIILAGHSLGSNKIINYLGNTSDNFIDYFIVTAPVDLAHWFNVMPNIKKCIELAKEFVADGRGDEILPYLFGGFSPMTANTALKFNNAFNLKNCPVITNDGETNSLSNIKIKGAFVIGSNDSLTNGDSEGFIHKINSYCQKPQDNQITVIDDASHIFYGKHEEYAQTLLSIVRRYNETLINSCNCFNDRRNNNG